MIGHGEGLPSLEYPQSQSTLTTQSSLPHQLSHLMVVMLILLLVWSTQISKVHKRKPFLIQPANYPPSRFWTQVHTTTVLPTYMLMEYSYLGVNSPQMLNRLQFLGSLFRLMAVEGLALWEHRDRMSLQGVEEPSHLV